MQIYHLHGINLKQFGTWWSDLEGAGGGQWGMWDRKNIILDIFWNIFLSMFIKMEGVSDS